MVRVVFQRYPDLADSKIQTLFVIDKGFGSPHLLRQFLSSYDFSGPADQQCQHPRRLRLKLDRLALPAQLTSAEIQFEGSEPQKCGRTRICTHPLPRAQDCTSSSNLKQLKDLRPPS